MLSLSASYISFTFSKKKTQNKNAQRVKNSQASPFESIFVHFGVIILQLWFSSELQIEIHVCLTENSIQVFIIQIISRPVHFVLSYIKWHRFL